MDVLSLCWMADRMKSVLHSCQKWQHFLTRMVAVVGAIGYN